MLEQIKVLCKVNIINKLSRVHIKQNLTQMIDQSVTIDCNIILVEGFKDEHFDKVVVYQTTEELERLKQLTDVKYCYDVHDKHALSHYDNWLLQWIEQRD